MVTSLNPKDDDLGEVRYFDVEGMPYRVAGLFPVGQTFRNGTWVAGRLLTEVIFNGQRISPEEMCAWLTREMGATGDPTAIPFTPLWRKSS